MHSHNIVSHRTQTRSRKFLAGLLPSIKKIARIASQFVGIAGPCNVSLDVMLPENLNCSPEEVMLFTLQQG